MSHGTALSRCFSDETLAEAQIENSFIEDQVVMELEQKIILL